MAETRRFKCANCGEENPRRLHEEADKTHVLYYSMQGAPVYKKRLKCGNCGSVFDKV
jgi:ribosomal protein S27AE